MKLTTLEPEYSICKLAAGEPIPVWATKPFTSITITNDELSIVTESARMPKMANREEGWRMFQITGQLEFDQIGVIARISMLLADAAIPIFVVSTFETDFFLVKSDRLQSAKTVLEAAGYEFV